MVEMMGAEGVSALQIAQPSRHALLFGSHLLA